MLVYGDHAERADARSRLLALRSRMEDGPWSHDELTSLFVELAGITQGVADADFTEAGLDRLRPAELQLLEQLTVVAAVLLQSWDAGRAGATKLPPLAIGDDLPGQVEIRLPEGYAFYALRPEAYALAARQLKLNGEPRVIGLRSIGTGLACMTAAALNAAPPVTLRPVNDPFGRQPCIDDELAINLLVGDPHLVIVDEGPGLSGSSFGGVADWLDERGVPTERIAFLPGHSNPLGPQASARHRERWSGAQRPVVGLDEPPTGEIEAIVGPLSAPLLDLSSGRWRPLWCASENDWPAIDPTWERRKFLAQSTAGKWLVKWAGLGAIGERKLALARQLTPWISQVAGLTGGWLISHWHDDAVPTRPSMGELTAYLELRASITAAGPGATLDTLATMVRRNVPAFSNWAPDLRTLDPRPVCTDNRMAAQEWLRLPSGQLLKADALDHHQSHDLVGCQDIAWDVAGAITELDLGRDEAEQLRAALEVPPDLLAFTLIAYRAFRIGAHRMSAASLDHWPDEQRRHVLAGDRLEAQLTAVNAVENTGHVY